MTKILIVEDHALVREAMAQRIGLEVLFLLRREERWVEVGLGRFGTAAPRDDRR